jgi:phosphatidylserine/phosphatidylglycerophosphate/cardiolipin synthase-like enzyme
MVEFLTTHGTAFHIERIIARAKRTLVLVSPYLQLSKTLLERLLDADRRGVRITIVYGKSSLSADQEEALRELKDLSLCYLENLHAKCYFNEEEMVITSMNMYEFSEKNNREMGVLVDKAEKVYQGAVEEARSIVAAAEQAKSRGRGGYASPEQDPGFCIRCSRRTPYDPDIPYCRECFRVWSQYENANYREEVCHSCGRKAETSMNKPLCYGCYIDEVS